jgi:hypothetical protein
MDDLKERMREWWEYDPGHLIPQALTRIEALEAQLAKADALADEMERLIRRTPFVPAPNGISVTIGIDQVADQRIALAAYQATKEQSDG